MSTEHTPDRSRLATLGEWREMDAFTWEDGTQFLAAVPVESRFQKGKWSYEYSVVTVSCDEGYFRLLCYGETWEWSLDDVDFFIVLSGKAD